MVFNLHGYIAPMLITRHIETQVLNDLTFFPAVGILGPRQVGKTTFAKTLQVKLIQPSFYLDLEDEATFTKLTEPGAYLSQYPDHCIIIDEVQLMPRLFGQLRSLIDQARRPARFILLGSASPTILRESAESLAGRIAYTELTPLSLAEVQSQVSQSTHWLRGGFPDSLLAPTDLLQHRWMQNFVQTFIQRDLRNIGYIIPQNILINLLRMLTQVNGNLLNMSDLSRSLGVSQPTVGHYLDVLEGSFLISRLQPYFANVSKRLVKAPKLLVRDSGLLHHLANITTYDQLLGHMLVGGSWESYVIEQIRRAAPDGWQFYYYRTHTGAEMDLVLISPNGKKIGVEIKFSTAPTLTRGFYESQRDLNVDSSYIIIPSGEKYPRANNVWVINLADFIRAEFGE